VNSCLQGHAYKLVGPTVFRGKNLTNSAANFGKFRGSPRQGRWNSAAHRGYTVTFPRLD